MAVRLKSYEFRREREGTWTELEGLVTRVEKKGIGSLSGAELMRMPRLYRSALSSLSVARAISLDKNLLEYLEALCQRAYFAVYGVRRHLRDVIADFFLRAFPASVRRFGWHALLATATLGVAVLAGYVLTTTEPERFYAFVSSEMASGRGPDATTAELRETLYSTGHEADSLGAFSSLLFTHNARVGMLCFALGFAAGAPVFVLLLLNGLMLGAFWAIFAARGLGGEFWAWVLPHGVTEIGAIILCAAGGLALAQALLFPGRLGRLENLARRGREAAMLLLGTIVMFLIAGIIEGVFRQVVHDVTVRWTVALLTTLAWCSYFALAGRSRRSA